MALQNRVTPRGEIVADPARGTLMGNRGILHDDTRRLGRRRWQHKTWITCVTEFRGRHRAVMTPHRYTELFFLDEAVALATGHRPCYECRRADFHAWQAAWRQAFGLADPPRAPEMDAVLHRERVDRRTRRQRTWRADIASLPDDAFVEIEGNALLLRGTHIYPWRPDGYDAPLPRPDRGHVTVLTPPATVAVLAAGFRPRLHVTAR